MSSVRGVPLGQAPGDEGARERIVGVDGDEARARIGQPAILLQAEHDGEVALARVVAPDDLDGVGRRIVVGGLGRNRRPPSTSPASITSRVPLRPRTFRRK